MPLDQYMSRFMNDIVDEHQYLISLYSISNISEHQAAKMNVKPP